MKKNELHPIFNGMGAAEYFAQRIYDSEKPSPNGKQFSLDANEKHILSKMQQKIEFPQPILSLNDQGIMYPNTITLIQGKSGVHKSRLSSHIMSALLSSLPNEIAGLKRKGLEKFNVISIDTERSINDLLPYAMQSVITDAGYAKKEMPGNFRTTSLVNIDRKSRLDEVKTYISKAIHQTTLHNVLFLDVISDLIEDFNNVSSSLQLLDYLNSMINEFNITIVAVIHENPGSMDKSRGHLGTELHNKSSSVIQISGEKGKDNKSINLQKLSILKSRYTAAPEPIYYSYNPISRRLEQQDAEFAQAIAQKKVEIKAPIDEIFEFFKARKPHEKIKNKDLSDKLCERFRCSTKLLNERLQEIQESNDFLGYRLKSEMVGREKFYWMESQLSIMEEGSSPI